jgi:hypothetical protein
MLIRMLYPDSVLIYLSICCCFHVALVLRGDATKIVVDRSSFCPLWWHLR